MFQLSDKSLTKKYTVGSLFSGIGGLDLAAQWAGFETSWFVEKDSFCQRVLKKHWPNTVIYDDVFECKNLPHVDVVVGGFPCQPFSIAGLRKGREDERYLLPEMLRIVKEIGPYVVLFENVPGFSSIAEGEEHKFLLKEIAKMGYDAEWGYLRASDIGAPHQRERFFCLAYSTNRGVDWWNGVEKHADPSRKGWWQPAGIRDDEFNKTIMAYSDNNWIERRVESKENACESGCQSSGSTAAEIIELGDTSSKRSQREGGSEQEKSKSSEPSGGDAQSRVGRATNGVPCGMDFVGWPARPNEPQYEWESPRVKNKQDIDNRRDRIKALGNAVVPQVAYPIMQHIYQCLSENDV